MRGYFSIACAIAVVLGLSASNLYPQSGPFDGKTFQGRIAYSADGNHNDPDDWAASPIALAIFAEARVKDRLVHFDYNCILPQTNPEWEKIHAVSVLGAAEKYRYDQSVFHDCQKDLAGAVASIAKAIDQSSADNPLYFIVAGPMEVPYLGIQKSDPAKRKHVYCISHSRWNDGFARNYTFTHTKRSVIALGVNWVQIKDQNPLLSTSPYGRPAKEVEWQPWHWMRDSNNSNVRWLWERMQVSTRPDPSDSGMAYFLVTGDEEADPAKLKRLLDEQQVPKPVSPRSQVRLEAENFSSLDGFELEDRNDRNASHRLNVRLTNHRSGRIRTIFRELYRTPGERFDIEVRYAAGGSNCQFCLYVNGQQQGAAWNAANRSWTTQTIPGVSVQRDDEIIVEVQGDSVENCRLDYLQLNALAPRVGSSPSLVSAAPQTWQRWEHALSSAHRYTNPYSDVTLRVTYTGPEGRTLRTYGFWDGGDTFRIRCAFPTSGTWQWQTECSDTSNVGLHGRRGEIKVLPYSGDNPLYRHGFLKVSDNRRYLAFGDATPFLWIGDTAWAVPHKASPEEWEQYLADRAAKHFTVIQVAPAPDWAGERDRQGQKPFTDKTCGQWNPVYWQSFEHKVQRANESGFVVMLVGLMEPVSRYPETSKACLFARNIVARLFGNFVVFSPSFDSEVLPLAHEVGRATREATAVHLVTQHPGTPWNQPVPTFSTNYYDQPYLDFVGVQSGHNAGHLDWCAHHAIEWNLHLYRHEPHKPVINLEAMYDGQGTNGWRAVDARSLGWRTWLSGAMGYTYGAGETPPNQPGGNGGVYLWASDPEKYDFWKKALQWESAFQMQYLHDFLAAIDWWRLEPAHGLIRNQPEDVTHRMVLARSAAGDLAVAYLPDNNAIEIDMASFPMPLAARWFDPVKGRYTSIAGSIENKGTHRFAPSARGDWVLLLERNRR